MNHIHHDSLSRLPKKVIVAGVALLAAAAALLPQPARAHAQANQAAAQTHAQAAVNTDCVEVRRPLGGAIMKRIQQNIGVYKQVMNETGVPWELLAAIHYRETNFSRVNPKNGQGIFQFVYKNGGPYPAGPVNDQEFHRQLKYLANRLQNDYVWRGSLPRERRQLQPDETNDVLVKDTLFSYNGRAKVYASQATRYGFDKKTQPYEGSPYVMNVFDCDRLTMGIIKKDFGKVSGVDIRYGAFTLYDRLRAMDTL